MNIFYLDPDAGAAARYHCDSHVVKMILETAQLLSTAHRIIDGPLADPCLYKATHVNHPCAVWVRETHDQYMWAYWLFTELSAEYQRRFSKVHMSTIRLTDELSYCPAKLLDIQGLQPPPQCMPELYQVPGEPITAYRNYYRKGKRHLHKWSSPATQPEWL